MWQSMQRWCSVATVLVVLAGLWACAGQPAATATVAATTATASASPVLRVGLSPDYPPMAYREDGQLKGLEVELASAVAAHMGMQAELVPMPWAELLPALMRGDIDVVMSGMTITPERAGLVAFSDSYMSLGQMAIIRIRDAGRFRTPLQALDAGAKVGFVQGTTGEAFIEATPGVKARQAYASVEQGLKALASGAIDMFIHDAPTSWDLAVSPWADSLISLYRPLTKEELGWAVRKDDTQRRDALNAALRSLRESGRLEAMQYRWIPVQIHLEE